MASVGAVNFFTLKGTLPAPSQKSESLERANVNGTAYRKTGVRAEVGSVIGGVDVSAGNLETLEDSIYALEGTFQDVTLGTGETYDDVYIERAYCRPPRAEVIWGGIAVSEGAAGFWLEVQFEMRRTS